MKIKKLINITLASVLAAIVLSVAVTSQTVIEQRPLTALGLTTGMSFGTALPTVANDGRPPFDGEPFVIRNSGSDPLYRLYNESTTSWDTTPMLENANVYTGGNTYRVQREDFEGPYLVINWTDGTYVPTVADDAMNMLQFPNLLIAYEHEVAFGGTSTASTYINNGIDAADAQGRVWLVDDTTMVDATSNEGVEFVFGGTEIDAVIFIEEATDSLNAYCEVGIRIDDISDLTDEDLYFGIFLATAIDNTFAWTGNNTYAAYFIDDNAGNLVIATSLNGGSDLEEDSSVVTAWGDNETHVLRIEIAPDTVTFTTDGTAETQGTAILNADATDEFVCRFGFRFAAAAPGVELNYVEIGKAQ